MFDALLAEVADAMQVVAAGLAQSLSMPSAAAARLPAIQALRERCLRADPELSPAERGAVLALLGNAERSFVLVERIDAERRSVPRLVAAGETAGPARPDELGGAAPVPA